ncbi:hypothetical protein GCG54_00007166 [Colletotrichum gloeosporioides]|uniref:Uncharacterized protein n=2 Tax=Colletotrichum gloeosporioides TaxID=474922 RepID=T0KGU6_COLGC|nr:uncharacterized protein GCG54_00007166 [Colletotrichum gloeosporioides]EQB51339.1 hypothetical protein CGLO_09135 [Colletotrichum gloeosporioides Cg-14]KAF3806915.1 hypothetical protein GCG54_00007166 [Colletotrichum gloeosporioides]
MVSAAKILSSITLLAATVVAQRERRCFCSKQDLSEGAPPMEERVDVGWTTQACADQGFMRGNACIIVADETRENDFQNDCLEISGLQTTGCLD